MTTSSSVLTPRAGRSRGGEPRRREAPGPALAAVVAGVLAWVAIVVVARVVGVALYEEDPLVRIGAPPLVGKLDVRLGALVLPAVAFAALAIAFAPALSARLSFRRLAFAAWAGAAAWATLLALTDGPAALTEPLTSRYEYLNDVPLIGGPVSFLQTFVDDIAAYSTHTRGHPPLTPLVFWALDYAGLGGGVPATVLVIGAGALVAPAALVAARELAGEAAARRAAPFFVLAPMAVFVATSADAMFAGVAACGIALFALATGRGRATGDRGAAIASDGLALASGVVLGGALFLSYGVGPLGIAVLALAAYRRRVRPLVVAAVGVAIVFAAFLAAGFWWFDGLATTREEYVRGVAARRPYLEFIAINLGALALALGPAAAAGVAALRDRRLWVLVGAGLLAVAVAGLSGLSRGETERIWLPFMPWILLATAALAAADRVPRGWLAIQAALALVLQIGVDSAW